MDGLKMTDHYRQSLMRLRLLEQQLNGTVRRNLKTTADGYPLCVFCETPLIVPDEPCRGCGTPCREAFGFMDKSKV